VRRLENGLAESAPPRRADCSSAAIAARANKRRFVNLLQQLARSTFRRLPLIPKVELFNPSFDVRKV